MKEKVKDKQGQAMETAEKREVCAGTETQEIETSTIQNKRTRQEQRKVIQFRRPKGLGKKNKNQNKNKIK